MFQKNPNRNRGQTLYTSSPNFETTGNTFTTGNFLDPSSLASRRRSSSICVGDLQIMNERRLPPAPVRKATRTREVRQANRARLNTICSQEVFNDQAPRYDFYDDYKPMQYSYVKYEPQDHFSRSWRWVKKRKHVVIPWTIGIAVAIVMTVLILTQTVQDFKH
ncbi:unnamed protein product, partial [Mesorhabditis belari]|uniref:Uncharacterized protein n=1 Tax=Mesorhabditis belari TaxID=2138241 RepID=A0AAF3F367_9BILA